MDLKLIENTKASKIYGMMEVKERYYCNFGINPDLGVTKGVRVTVAPGISLSLDCAEYN